MGEHLSFYSNLFGSYLAVKGALALLTHTKWRKY
jgi:hypothetical protein